MNKIPILPFYLFFPAAKHCAVVPTIPDSRPHLAAVASSAAGVDGTTPMVGQVPFFLLCSLNPHHPQHPPLSGTPPYLRLCFSSMTSTPRQAMAMMLTTWLTMWMHSKMLTEFSWSVTMMSRT